ncbi:MAG: protein kinase [Planctomycetes bacterium]|nr:protein kinase [Planctomycetota bacterium]
MSEERRKSIVAALLAVHSGIIGADEAVAALKEPGKASTLVDFDGNALIVSVSGENGESLELPIIEVLNDPGKQRRALEDIGISDNIQQTLFNFGAGDVTGNGDETRYRVLHDTFKQIAGSGRRLADTEIRPGAEQPADSESPTHAPRDNTGVLRLTTGKFFPNFGVNNERYHVRREHARGGMGRIMLARDQAIGRDIALKELLPGMTGNSSIPGSVPQQYTNDSGGVVERFLREAKITGQLEHPNIVPVYEIGKHEDGSIYYTMRFVRGKTLADRLREIRKDETLNKQQRLAARIRLLDSFIDVCQAIAYAHSKGVIHRDLKPENIMLGDFGETQVLDWGLARVKGQEDKAMRDLQKGTLALSKSLIESDSQALTLDGSIVGTPAYMPPEQARGELENVDEQSDVYALGAVLYQILTGSPPYEGPMAALIVQQVLGGPPLRVGVRERDVPPELQALVEKAMAREKKDRIGSALELAGEVKAFRDGRTLGSYQYSATEMFKRYIAQHRTTVGVGVLGFLLLVAGTIFFMQRLTEERDEAQTAQRQAEEARGKADESLALANFERSERERVEEEARVTAQEELNSRVDEARRLIETIDGMRIEPALHDLRNRVAEYEARLAGPPALALLELPVDEQTGNDVLLSSMLGYISSKQTLIDLLTGPAGTELPGEVAQIDLEAERKELIEIRFDTARLASFNGDFQLAILLLGATGMPAERLAAARAEVQASRNELLKLHGTRISQALADVREGLYREWRDPDAPDMDEYIRRLSTYRERQTIGLLSTELDSLLSRNTAVWSRSEFDLAKLICRVLGNVNQPAEAIVVLSGLLSQTERPELVHEAAMALCATGSADALTPLFEARDRLGLDFWREVSAGVANLPLPARLRNPVGAADWTDRAAVLIARGDFPTAELAAGRALNLDEKSVAALILRALAYFALGRPGDAEADLNEALAIDPDNFEALLERGHVRNAAGAWEPRVADFSLAIKQRPKDYRGYLARGRVYGSRYSLPEARADFDKALDLQPWRLDTYLEYADLMADRGDPRAGETIMTRAIEKWPGDWRTWSKRSWLRRHYSLGGGAMEDATQAVALNPEDSVALCVLTQLHFAHGRHIDGLDTATRSVESDPQQWLSWYYRGLHWHMMAQKEDRTRFSEATATSRNIGGEDPVVDAGAEFLNQRREKLTNAASDFAAASRIEPTDFRTSYLLADSLIQLERYDDAQVVIEEALARNPFCHMRWGGGTIPIMRWWLDALSYRHLLDAQPSNAREAIGKAMMLAVRGGASVYMVREEAQAGAMLEGLRLLREQSRANLASADLVLLCHAQDRMIEALMSGGGRAYNLDVLDLCADRERLGRFLDGAFYLNKANALAGLAEMHRAGKFTSVDPLHEKLPKLRALDAIDRYEAEQAALAAAVKAILDGANAGLRVSDLPSGWEGGSFEFVTDTEGWALALEALRAPAGTRSESLYDEIVLLVDVTEGAPAWQYGLRRFDEIRSMNGNRLRSFDDFIAFWGPIPPGTEVKVSVRRYAIKDGALVPARDARGKTIADEDGFVAWQFEDSEITVKRGFLGVSIGQGMAPPRYSR